MRTSVMKERWSEYPLRADDRPRKIFEYYATGRGDFPFDMLRYDHCWPVSGTDSALMDAAHYGREMRSVRLRSYVPPTIERWSSFGWSVGLENLGRKQ